MRTKTFLGWGDYKWQFFRNDKVSIYRIMYATSILSILIYNLSLYISARLFMYVQIFRCLWKTNIEMIRKIMKIKNEKPLSSSSLQFQFFLLSAEMRHKTIKIRKLSARWRNGIQIWFDQMEVPGCRREVGFVYSPSMLPIVFPTIKAFVINFKIFSLFFSSFRN